MPTHALPAVRRLFLILITGSCLLTLAAKASAGIPAETQAVFDAKIKEFMDKHQVPGLSAAIGVDNKLCYEKGYGLADIENDVPATAETIYRLASISKMLTGVAVMQLVEAGKIDLSAPIQKYVEGFPEKQAPITCQLLLKHQSGIRHYRGNEVRSNASYARVRDSFGVFQDDPLLFNPGERFSYTTYGYNVLGAAIEGASGEDYVSYVKKHVCEPAGMESIRPDSPFKIIPHRAAGYRKSGPGLINDNAVDVSNKIPGGGWCSTAGDLVRFAGALAEGKLVDSQTLEQMWTPQNTTLGKQTNVGFGCFIDMVADDRLVSHSGGQPKVSTYLVFSPARKTAVALMCNLRDARVRPLAEELIGMLGKEGAEAVAPARAQ
jgi:CubicO group peptidase (beta-lactamase class C family)